MITAYKGQSGTAMALVLWLLAAMSVTVAGAVSLSRDEVSLADDGFTSAKAFYLGKGVARLVMHDRWVSRLSNNESAGSDDRPRAIFSRRYRIAGADVDATVIPATGFISLVGSEPDTWRTLFTALGGMDPSAAQQVASELSGLKGPGTSVEPANLTGFGAYKYRYGGGEGNVAHIESLLRLEGMTRDTYERVRGFIAPMSGPAQPNLLFAPVEIKSAFGGENTNDFAREDGVGSGFCVELSMNFDAGSLYMQRIWVVIGDSQSAALDLVRVDRPVRLNQGGVG